MNAKESNYLDIFRVVASFAVLFQHLSMFNNNVFPGMQGYGHQAVMAFFVLSGYVIAYVSDQREREFSTYMKHRLARIYSVMVIAWLLTAILDSVGPKIDSATYVGVVATDNLPIRVLAHLLFLNESWFLSIQFFGNQPLWSLAYEFSYYLLFGLCFLYKGRFKIPLALLVAMLMGPVILIYGLIWLSGVLLYWIHKERPPINIAYANCIFLLTIPVIFLYPYWQHFLDFNTSSYKKFSTTAITKDFVFGLFVCLNIYCFKYTKYQLTFLRSYAKFFSNISFSLYVFHFPLMYFYGAVLRKYFNPSNEQMFFLLTVLIVLTVYLLSFISEKRKRSYYQLFDWLFRKLGRQFSIKTQNG
ncbi:MAG: acyltransferase [Pseudomonadota bacterium]